MIQQKQKVAQIWYQNQRGEERPHTNKFYSKIGVAENLAKRYNLKSAYHFFVRVYSIEHLGDNGK